MLLEISQAASSTDDHNASGNKAAEDDRLIPTGRLIKSAHTRGLSPLHEMPTDQQRRQGLSRPTWPLMSDMRSRVGPYKKTPGSFEPASHLALLPRAVKPATMIEKRDKAGLATVSSFPFSSLISENFELCQKNVWSKAKIASS